MNDTTVRGSISQAGKLIRSALPDCASVALVYDRELRDSWRDPLLASLRGAGFRVCAYSIRPEGERGLSALDALACFLFEKGIDKADALVALGSDHTSALALFAAATYMGGIPIACVPVGQKAADTCTAGQAVLALHTGEPLIELTRAPDLVLLDGALTDAP